VLAEEAERMGLLNAVLPPEELLPHTLAYARDLVRTVSPQSLAATKRQIYTDLHRDVASSVTEAEDLLRQMMREPAFREGVAALLERRTPRFR